MYDAASPGYRGRCTAPLLVDRRTRRAVCNESSVIVRNLNAVHLPGCTPIDLFPAAAAAEIEQVNELVYDKARARHQRPSRPCHAWHLPVICSQGPNLAGHRVRAAHVCSCTNQGL